VPDDILKSLETCANAINEAIIGHRGRGYSGLRETQYHLDLAADAVAVELLTRDGFRVISEESGVTGEGEYTVVVDPIDGSTNCDRGVPFFATSLAVLRGEELVAGLVMNQATGDIYKAARGAGATRNGDVITVNDTESMAESIVAFSGYPDRHLGWSQYRALGAASLEICLVADGSLDVFGVAQHSTLNPWDYLAGLLILEEAGGVVGDYLGEDLVISQMAVRHPIFCATPTLLDFMLSAGVI
jgi:myo-inositol-1(or 4)-monophosphatase